MEQSTKKCIKRFLISRHTLLVYLKILNLYIAVDIKRFEDSHLESVSKMQVM